MIDVYVGFCALRWLYVSCEMTDDTSSRVNFAGTNSPINYFFFFKICIGSVSRHTTALWVRRLQGFSSGRSHPKIGFIVQSNHHLSACGAEDCCSLPLAPMQIPHICLCWSKATLCTLPLILQGIKVVHVASWLLTGTGNRLVFKTP